MEILTALFSLGQAAISAWSGMMEARNQAELIDQKYEQLIQAYREAVLQRRIFTIVALLSMGASVLSVALLRK